jgi:ferrous iron transport protein B
MEEIVARDAVLDDNVDILINVVDASNLERSLYLTLQVIALGKPVVVALNMMDIVNERGMEIDLHRLPEILGCPVIPVSARKETGLSILMHAVAHHEGVLHDPIIHHHDDELSRVDYRRHKQHVMVYSDEIEEQIEKIEKEFSRTYPRKRNYRWYAIETLERDKVVLSDYPIDKKSYNSEKNYEVEIINQKYDFIEDVVSEVLVNKAKKQHFSDRIDKILTHHIWSLPIFLGIMALVFFLTFTVGDFLKGYFELGIEMISNGISYGLQALHVGPILTSLVIDGIVGGVGGILSFLPNIFILFLILGILEDSGYMARVAFVMDDIMNKLGLSGKAFVPLLLGFGCSVPAIMSARTLNNNKDRIKTIAVVPFMSCSAKLPIYVLFSLMFFPKHHMLVAYSLYIIGILVALGTAFFLSKIDKKKTVSDLLIELPEYKMPNGRTVAIFTWEKVKDYLVRAGTIILLASIILWLVLNIGPHGYTTEISTSFGAMIGKFLAPIFKPAGLGEWQIVLSLIAGLAAKEVVVSSVGVILKVSNISSVGGMAQASTLLASIGFGAVNAYALMVFSLLYVPCTAAMATMAREVKNRKVTLLILAYQLFVAWLLSVITYQIGIRL